jgi:uncharacterized protein
VRIEFDPAKRDDTLLKRGLDFARAPEIFDGPHFTREDRRADYQETRFVTTGLLDGHVVLIVWTERGENHRIISMRRAHERERESYQRRLD